MNIGGGTSDLPDFPTKEPWPDIRTEQVDGVWKAWVYETRQRVTEDDRGNVSSEQMPLDWYPLNVPEPEGDTETEMVIWAMSLPDVDIEALRQIFFDKWNFEFASVWNKRVWYVMEGEKSRRQVMGLAIKRLTNAATKKFIDDQIAAAAAESLAEEIDQMILDDLLRQANEQSV